MAIATHYSFPPVNGIIEERVAIPSLDLVFTHTLEKDSKNEIYSGITCTHETLPQGMLLPKVTTKNVSKEQLAKIVTVANLGKIYQQRIHSLFEAASTNKRKRSDEPGALIRYSTSGPYGNQLPQRTIEHINVMAAYTIYATKTKMVGQPDQSPVRVMATRPAADQAIQIDNMVKSGKNSVEKVIDLDVVKQLDSLMTVLEFKKNELQEVEQIIWG